MNQQSNLAVKTQTEKSLDATHLVTAQILQRSMCTRCGRVATSPRETDINTGVSTLR